MSATKIVRRALSIISGTIGAGAITLAIFTSETARIVFGAVGVGLAAYAIFLWEDRYWEGKGSLHNPVLGATPGTTNSQSAAGDSEGCLFFLFLLVLAPGLIIVIPIFFFGLYWYWGHWVEFLIVFVVLLVIVSAITNS